MPLKDNETYYYKYRYLYLDGHVSDTTEPVVAKTTSTNRKVKLYLKVDTDLNDKPFNRSYANIEIFRKRGGGEFKYLTTLYVDQMEVLSEVEVEFVDDGLIAGGILNEVERVQFDNHKVMTEVDDRVVKANVSYPNRNLPEYTQNTLSLIPQNKEVGNPMVPINTDIQLYGRGIYPDGQKSFHFPLTERLRIDQPFFNIAHNTPIDFNLFREFDSINIYLGVDNDVGDDEATIPFDTIEVNNNNIPTLGSWENEFYNYNARPNIFIGWKFFRRRVTSTTDNGDGTYTVDYVDEVKDADYDSNTVAPNSINTNVDQHIDSYFVFNTGTKVVTASGASEADLLVFDDTINAQIVRGNTLPYTKHIVYEVGSTICWYRLSFADALKKAVNESDIRLRMTGTTVQALSSVYSNNEIIELDEEIEYIFDTAGNSDIRPKTYDADGNGTSDQPYFEVPNSRLYAVLPIDSIFNQLDSEELLNTSAVGDYSMQDGIFDILATNGLDATASFELVNLKHEYGDDNSSSTLKFPNIATTYELYNGLEGNIIPTNIDDEDFLEDNLIYIGNVYDDSTFKERISGINGFKYTGFEYSINGRFRSTPLNESNIYEQSITRDDVKLFKDEYPTQLVWSERTEDGELGSGHRTFLFTSYLNTSSQYGEIVKLEAIGNNLLVFYEYGVGLIKVGEKLASNNSGDIYVASSQLLNDPMWLLKSVPAIQPESVTVYENMIIFCDGADVWSFSGQLDNLTQGAIDVDGYCVGAIDPEHKEYRITVFDEEPTDIHNLPNGVTYSRSFETGQWTGPHTYTATNNANISDKMISVVESGIVRQNEGNTYGGVEYDTVIESVSNVMGEPHRAKRFRMFYLDVDKDEADNNSVDFFYASEYFDNPFFADVTNRRQRRGSYRIGVRGASGRPSVSNSFFWRLATRAKDFVLRSISFDYYWK